MTNLGTLIGSDNLERLQRVAGGTRLHIPLNMGPPPTGGRNGFARLSDLVGAELAALLVFHFADSRIYVPVATRSGPVDPKAVARLDRRGLKLREIVRLVGCSEGTVLKHRKQTRAGLTVRKRTLERKERAR